jgi:ketosteroid isomerase-like protein
MSRENIEVVRDFYASLDTWLASLSSGPAVPLEQSPGVDDLFDHLESEAEWDWLFSPETFRGREQLLEAVADYLETVGEWRVDVEELIDGTGDRVLAMSRVVARGKGSGAPVLQPIFTVFTVRNGKVARIEDHTERSNALEAAGLSE